MIKHIYYLALLLLLGGCGTVSNSNQKKPAPEISKLINSLERLNYTQKQTMTMQGTLADSHLTYLRKKFKNKPEFLKELIKFKKTTITLLKQIDKLKIELETKAGGNYNPEKRKLNKPMETILVKEIMIKQKKAYELKKRLDIYIQFLNDTYKKIDTPQLGFITKSSKKDYAHTYFENTPVIIAVMYLTQLENIILRYEEEVIKYMILSLVTDKK